MPLVAQLVPSLMTLILHRWGGTLVVTWHPWHHWHQWHPWQSPFNLMAMLFAACPTCNVLARSWRLPRRMLCGFLNLFSVSVSCCQLPVFIWQLAVAKPPPTRQPTNHQTLHRLPKPTIVGCPLYISKYPQPYLYLYPYLHGHFATHTLHIFRARISRARKTKIS